MLHIHDFGRPELVDRLIQRLEAKFGLQRIGYPLTFVDLQHQVKVHRCLALRGIVK